MRSEFPLSRLFPWTRGQLLSTTSQRKLYARGMPSLHFRVDLGDEKQAVCINSATALDNRIHAEQFALWISSGKEKVRKNVFLLACMN